MICSEKRTDYGKTLLLLERQRFCDWIFGPPHCFLANKMDREWLLSLHFCDSPFFLVEGWWLVVVRRRCCASSFLSKMPATQTLAL
jgi:hypothetical protein